MRARTLLFAMHVGGEYFSHSETQVRNGRCSLPFCHGLLLCICFQQWITRSLVFLFSQIISSMEIIWHGGEILCKSILNVCTEDQKTVKSFYTDLSSHLSWEERRAGVVAAAM